MTKEQEVICVLASVALWSARRAKSKYYRQFATNSVIEALETIKDSHMEISYMYRYATMLLAEEATE